jgi:hypothetical protein
MRDRRPAVGVEEVQVRRRDAHRDLLAERQARAVVLDQHERAAREVGGDMRLVAETVAGRPSADRRTA